MRHHLLSFCLIFCAGWLLASCSRGSMQYRISPDGSVKRVSPSQIRDDYQQSLAAMLQEDLGPDWIVQVSISQLPYYENDERSMGGDDNWRWEHLNLAARIIGREGMDVKSIDDAELEKRLRGQLWSKVDARLNVVSTVVLADDASYGNLAAAAINEKSKSSNDDAETIADEEPLQEDAASSDKTETSTENPTNSDGSHGSIAPAKGQRRYVIQKGDTLALISSVFYGKADAWRMITKANPELDPTQPLPVGREIIIP